MLTNYILIACLIFFLSSMTMLVVRTKKRTGVFPIITGNSGVYGYVSKLVLLSYVLVIANVVLYTAGYAPIVLFTLMPVVSMPAVQTAGLILIIVSLILLSISQMQMGTSWRVGIDTKHEIALVDGGLFRYFRHPIYFFAILIVFGMVCVIPSTASIIIFVFLYIALSIQTRLEEEFMLEKFGDAYREFMKTHRRFF